ncbi:MAG: SDR family NAD(P)-dependent oxidoreductase [Betaproteobacteria bacterium]|nr:SDR family NAD(P)-dependent oxidoreductase [Betaproteobacteria bacterium]
MTDTLPTPASPPAAALTPLQRAFLALEQARARVAELEEAAREPIAIIGLGCRVPGGGDDAESFWRIMRDGVDAIGPLPADRWDVEGTYDPDPEAPGCIATRGGGFLGDVRGFDPAHFGITRREALGMDPQQRLLLEVAWEALENAGQAPDRLSRSPTGVYVGVTGSDYAYLQLGTRDPALLDPHFASGIGHSIVSGRVSYLLGLQGPALTIDTACSSSLVAVHVACQALRAGDCRMALAGGVNLILGPDIFVALSHSRMLAPDGRCKTFDAAADGFARGEGCGLLVLKRLAHARADGDRVLAVIRGSALNQDGPSSGLTVPNGPAQEAVIREAVARAGITPGDMSYIEAHGTGTELGDPLEVSALGAVFGPGREAANPLWIGSVKTNVGHLEAAAGVTGIIKVVLALRHREIPAHLHFKRPSPHIAWDDWPVRVPTAHMPWEPIRGRRIAGVSSFGFSGTNAHVVLEEAPPAAEPAPGAAGDPSADAPAQLFVLSGRDEAALAAMARRYARMLRTPGDASLADLCYSAATARAHLPHRAAILTRSTAQLREQLEALGEGRAIEGVRCARLARRDPARIAFLFTGQGAQYAGMARRLDETQPVFRAALDRCAQVLDARLPRPLRDVLRDESGALPLDETGYTQPALFALEYALASLWRAWGVQPDMLMGHSVGELVAACLGGVMSLEDGLALVAERGRLMQSLPPGGAMAAVFAAEADVARAIAAAPAGTGSRVSIAAQNGPLQTVISGAADSVDALCASLAADGVRCQRLPVSHAFHSPLVDPVLDRFEAAVAAVRLQPPTMRIVSNLTGALADAREVVRPGYWRRHLREAVRFADGMGTLAGLRPDVCLEIGPHPTLLAFAQASLEGLPESSRPALVASLRKGRDDREQVEEALGSLYLAGAAIDWRAVWSARPHRLVDLPAYAFQREPLWFPVRPMAGARALTGAPAHPLLGTRVRSPIAGIAHFESTVRPGVLPYLQDHRVQGRAILPGTGFLELGLAAGRAVLGHAAPLRDVVFLEPLAFEDDETRIVQVVVRRDEPGGARFEVFSARAEVGADPLPDAWRRHAEGAFGPAESAALDGESLEAVRARCGVARSAEEHRAALAARGLDFGPSLHGVRGIAIGSGEAVGEIAVPEPAVAGRGDYVLHPAMLDACLQVMSAALAGPGGADATAGRAYLPLAIESLQVARAPAGTLWSHARVFPAETPSRGTPPDMLKGEVTVYDAAGPVVRLRGVALRAAVPPAPADSPFHEIAWQPRPSGDAAWIPTPAALAAAAGPLLPGLAQAHGLDAYHDAGVALERLCTGWVADALVQLGWRAPVGERVERAALAASLGVVPRYERLLGRFLDILAEEGILRRETGGWIVARPLVPANATQAEADLQRLLGLERDSIARVQLAARCGPVLSDILRGRVDPLQQLFPGGSTDLAVSLYRDAPEARAFNQLVREAVKAALAALPEGRRVRVLEVGGGTGGTTAWVAPALPATSAEYLFTDVGPSLVMKARERFAEHAFMQFQPLDLEQPLEPQGLEGRRFDLILASNVVHATADLRGTLDRLRAMLEPGGTLLMLEVGGLERWIDVTFGLTEGWWRFTDVDLRRDYPLLSRPAWLELLRSAGFEAAAIGEIDARSNEVLLAGRKPPDAPVAWTADGRWLVIGDRDGLAPELAGRLRAQGREVLVFEGSPDDADALRRFVADHAVGAAGIVHLRALEAGAPPDADGSILPRQREVLGSALAVAQALGGCSFPAGAVPALWIATRGAVLPDARTPPGVCVDQASAWGLGKVIALEHPEWRCRRVDLDPQAALAEQAESLLKALRSPGREDQLARRAGTWYVPRLVRHVPAPAPSQPCRLEKGAGGSFDDLALRPAARRKPGPGEIEIRMRAAGLNLRDVMNALAMRDDPEPLGGECAGRVVAVGEGVTDLRVGDDVIAIAEASFASHAVARASLARRIPAGIGFAQAATLPFAFMTAWHALHAVGRMVRGETVLVHAGAGGVGMAAIQIAQAAGAAVIATAGSESKRALLRSLGVGPVFDSRTLDFAAEVRRVTGGRGVDLALNSLAGEFIPATVGCLATRGRFLEIGKRDILRPERFVRKRPEGAYHAIDLAAMRVEDPAGTEALFSHVMQSVEEKAFRPLPVQAFALERAAEAFRYMAMARHVGKVVLTQHDPGAASLDGLDAGATYLVTGGLGGLGLLTAGRLVERGARHLVLVGRRAPPPPATQAIDAMRARGATVTVTLADLSRPEAVRHVLAAIPPMRPLRGIVHSAGVLEDGALMQQDWERFSRPLGPKVDGSWALHSAPEAARLDFLVLYSSMAAMLGSSGQGNHAAANAFMDALAADRRARGLPALSIGWGAWREIGAAADRQVDARVAAQGLDGIAPQRGLAWLEELMRGSCAHVGVFPIRWDAWLAGSGAVPPFLEQLAVRRLAVGPEAPPPPTGAALLAGKLREASAARRHEMLLDFVGDQVMRVIGAPSRKAIDAQQPLNEMGLDSLMAVELRNRLGSGLGLARSLPATLVFDHPTLERLAAYLAREVAPEGESETPEPAATAPDAVGIIDDMSDEEIEQLFARKTRKS